MRLNSLLVVLVVLTALFSPSTSVVPAAQAASACEGGSAPVWNETAQRTALVPFSNWDGDYMYEDAYYEDDKPASDEIAEPSESDWDPALHPEERYTYNPTWPLPVLEPLTTGQFTTVQIGNDSVGVLRFNLSHLHRTTFCVSLYESVDGELQSVDGDIYLMTSSQYDSYQEVYRMMHGGWWVLGQLRRRRRQHSERCTSRMAELQSIGLGNLSGCPSIRTSLRSHLFHRYGRSRGLRFLVRRVAMARFLPDHRCMGQHQR